MSESPSTLGANGGGISDNGNSLITYFLLFMVL